MLRVKKIGVKKLVLENLPEFLTVQEIASLLRIHEMTVWRALKSGKLKGIKVSKKWRISKEEIIQWATVRR